MRPSIQGYFYKVLDNLNIRDIRSFYYVCDKASRYSTIIYHNASCVGILQLLGSPFNGARIFCMVSRIFAGSHGYVASLASL